MKLTAKKAVIGAVAATLGVTGVAATGCEPDNPPDHFVTIGVGQPLPDDCASKVDDAPEVRASNEIFNVRKGTNPHNTRPRVDGNYAGSTKEILQWAACKWGIEQDIVFAQAVRESAWFQRAGGDRTNTPSACHPAVRSPLPCPESVGILQVRFLYHGPAFEDGNSLWSTAYNADYAYSSWRACYEGEYTWLNDVERGEQYVAGDLWGCVGVWFAGRWKTPAANQYIANVQSDLAARRWEGANFASESCSSCHNANPPATPTTTTTTTSTTMVPSTAAPTTASTPTTTAPTVPTTTSSTTTQPPTTTTTTPPTGAFVLNFASPEDLQQLQFHRHHRNVELRPSDPPNHSHGPWPGDHDMACGDANTTRQVRDTDAEVFYLCREHLMSSMGDIDGYSILAFSPYQQFGPDTTQVCWNVNMTDLLIRQWVEVHLIPMASWKNHIAYVTPRDVGKDEMAEQMPPGALTWSSADNVNTFYVGRNKVAETTPFDLGNDKTTRVKHCLTELADGRIDFAQYRPAGVFVKRFPGQFPDNFRVVFGDHDYTPTKDGQPVGFTWHWDQIEVS